MRIRARTFVDTVAAKRISIVRPLSPVLNRYSLSVDQLPTPNYHAQFPECSMGVGELEADEFRLGVNRLDRTTGLTRTTI
jgi:hypothetical protein